MRVYFKNSGILKSRILKLRLTYITYNFQEMSVKRANKAKTVLLVLLALLEKPVPLVVLAKLELPVFKVVQGNKTLYVILETKSFQN